MTDKPCVFCEIVAGTSPATIVGQTRDSLIIVPLGPVIDGHVLFIPREHVADAGSVPEVTARVVRDAAGWGARRGVAFNLIASAGVAATQSVFHLHWHYVPRGQGDQLMVPWGTLHGENPQDPHRCKGMVALEQRLAPSASAETAEDLLHAAWGVIANVGHRVGGWEDQHAEWVQAAVRWRENYHAHRGLEARPVPSVEEIETQLARTRAEAEAGLRAALAVDPEAS